MSESKTQPAQKAEPAQKAKPETRNIYQRLLAVMEAVPYIQKEEKMVNNQYTFVSHDAVTRKMRSAFIKEGVAVIPTVLRRSQEGNRTEVDMRVEFINADNPEDRIAVESFGYGVDPQDKGPGKAMSYAMKYALLKACMLETGDNPEDDHIPFDPDAKPTFPPVSDKRLANLKAAFERQESLEALEDGFGRLHEQDKADKRVLEAYEARRAAFGAKDDPAGEADAA